MEEDGAIASIILLCTGGAYYGGAYYVPYSFLFIFNKFCNGGERHEQGD